MTVRERPAITALRNGGRRVRGSWQHITGGFELEQLWGQFLSEAKSSYGLYSHDVDWDQIHSEPKRWKRPFRIIAAFSLAMIMKLTPARRLLLIVAIVFTLLGDIRFAGTNNAVDLTWVGVFLLFVILALELADRVTMKRDLEIAREIQQWLVPEKAPEIPGIDIAFATRPQNTVSGDCYDAFLRPPGLGGNGSLVIAVADVAGKGVPAALLMATFQASLRALSGTPSSIEEIVHGLDRYARAHNLEGRRFTTAFLAEFDPAAGEMQYVNAGQNSPVLRRANGVCERLEAGGPPLGLPLFRGVEPAFCCGTVKLQPGDLLLVFTDGVVDAVNEDDEEFGEDQLIKLLRGLPQIPADDVRDRIMGEVSRFAGEARQHDDITCFVMRITDPLAPASAVESSASNGTT